MIFTTIQRYRTPSMLVIGLSSAIRILSCFQHNPLDYLFSDPLRHWKNAERLFHPDFMGMSDPIGYQVFLFLVQTLFAENRFWIAAVAASLSVGTPWLYYRAARALGLDRTRSLWAWALIAATPSLISIFHYFMMEALLLPLMGLALWLTGRALRKGTLPSSVLMVSAWTLAVSTKATIAPLAIVCIAWIWWHSPRKMIHALAIGLTGCLLLLPNTLRTKATLGFYAPLGNPWITKIQHKSGHTEIRLLLPEGTWGFASPSCFIQPLEPLSPWTIRRATSNTKVHAEIELHHGEEDWRWAYQKIEVSWRERFSQWIENIILFLFAPSWPDGNKAEWEGWLTHFTRWMWAPIIFWVLDCNIRDWYRRKFELLAIATAALTLFLMFQNVATTEGRYRKAAEPLLLINLVGTWPSRISRP